MPPLRDRIERALRQGFRLLNRLMVLLWRLGLGPSLSLAPTITGRYLMLTHNASGSGPRPAPFGRVFGAAGPLR